MVGYSNQETTKGHRERLRKKFMRAGINAFNDYEIIELLLTFTIARKNVKPIAKALIDKFGGIRGIFDADLNELVATDGIGKYTAVFIKFVKESASVYLKEQIKKKNILSSVKDVLNYCNYALSGAKKEKFQVIYLSSRNEIIDDEILYEGTVDQSAVYPRELVKNALKHNATALIFVHNHPSGDPTPSDADRKLTENLRKAVTSINISVHDHIIIGSKGYSSARESGWL